MTDLERARMVYGVIRDFGWDVLWRSDNPIPDDAWPIDIIANALAAGRREAAEEIRERAAAVVEAYPGYPRKRLDWEERVVRTCVDVIRALPLTPEQP